MQMDSSDLKLSEHWPNYSLLSSLIKMSKDYPEVNWPYALSTGQIISKIWIIETLRALKVENLGSVMVLGGWVGLLGHILLSEKSLQIEKIRSFDIDPICEKIADMMNVNFVSKQWKFKASCSDWNSLNYDETQYTVHRLKDFGEVPLNDRFDTIINTCCEHVSGFENWIVRIPSDRLLILQSNSSSEFEGHVNCHPSLDVFKVQVGLNRVLFEGSLDAGEYKRWMLIGYRNV